MEQILNLVWLAVATATCVAVLSRRRDLKAIAAVVALCFLLFPLISASDDLAADRTLVDAAAAILVAFVSLLGLRFLSRIYADQRQMRFLALPVHSDPRSPPRV